MVTRPVSLLSRLFAVFACAAAGAHAAELGEARVRSHIGQPLVAEVELGALEDPASLVGARLADPNVYRGANIAMPAVLGSLDISVTRREGRQFLQLSSGKPVESRHLHVYLELADGGGRQVRLVTLWLTPDPNPAPVPVPASARALATAPATALAAAPAAPGSPPAATVAAVAAAAAAKSATAPAARPAPRKVGASPAGDTGRASTRSRAGQDTPAAPEHAAPVLPAAQPGAPAPACAPVPARPQLDACVALGEKNATLRHELVRLEDRMNKLQALAGPAASSAHAPAQPAAPQAAPRIHVKPKKPAPIQPQAETPWLAIGGAVAALMALGGLLAVLKRRRPGKSLWRKKTARPVEDEGGGAPDAGVPKRSFMAMVKARLMPGSRADRASGGGDEGARQAPDALEERAAQALE